MTQSITPRQGALWFVNRGHRILPLHSINGAGTCTCAKADCHSPGKHPYAPLAPHGVKDATSDPDTVHAWFSEAYWLNYGIATDPFVVVDVDVKNGGLKRWQEMCSSTIRGLIHTWQVRTGSGGLHVFFQNPDGIHNGALDKGIDLRGIGGYVVGPTSKHVSGRTYDWVPQCAPKEAPLAELPPWLRTVIKNRTHCGRTVSIEEWRRRVRERVSDGERHARFLQVAGHLIANPMLDTIIARDLLLAWNLQNFDPPLPERDVLQMIENLAERELNKHQWIPPEP